MRKSFISLCLAVVILLASCGKNSETTVETSDLTLTNQQTVNGTSDQKQDDRTVITIAALNFVGYRDEEFVYAFNQSNEQYRIEVLEYSENNAGKEENEKARERMMMELTLGTNDCDLILLDPMMAGALSEQGVCEDLYPFLDSSEILDREDFFGGILDAYTVGDRLISIPYDVTVNMLAGKKSDFGEQTGWTLQEYLAYWKAHPETRLFYENNVYEVIKFLQNENDVFVTLKDEKVIFDSETCRNFLEWLQVQNTAPSAPYKAASIEQGETLMDTIVLYGWDSLQEARAVFSEPVVYLGYPNAEKNTCFVYGSTMNEYAISIHSDCKEGAWAFLEFYLTNETNTYNDSIPSVKNRFEEYAEWKLYSQYYRDDEGNILLDEDGLPRLTNQHSSGVRDDNGVEIWHVDYGPVTEEDMQQIRDFLEVGGGRSNTIQFNQSNAVYQIVMEEAEVYFSGRKPLDEVVDIIGNRLTLYMYEQQ